MGNSRVCLRAIGVAAGLILASTLLAHAQGGPPALDGKTAEQVYKNIKVLNGTPAAQLGEAMHLIEVATGMDCTVCHVEGAFDKDDKPEKATARKMMQMVMDINKNSFEGKQEVTCYTCHHGNRDPRSVPTVPTAKPAEEEEESKVTLPSVDQVLAKYVAALGGEQAVRKITSRVITGTQFIPTGPGGGVPMPATIERSQKAPNLVVNVYHTPTYTISDGFDGTKAWSQDMRGRVSEPQNIDQVRAKRDADFYLPLDMKKVYAKMEVRRIAKVNGHDAYVVAATPQGDNVERLYFDVTTGLLIRKATVLPTQAGNSPFQVDYDDYRNTGSGVKFPYLITMSPANPRTVLYGTATINVTQVEDNAPLETSKFVKPESKVASAQ
jgi:photosynthetic reaction center cytochrome c subunit